MIKNIIKNIIFNHKKNQEGTLKKYFKIFLFYILQKEFEFFPSCKNYKITNFIWSGVKNVVL